ncbi:MAG: hypothetical protein LBK54_05745 [Propionibacteriaceae bacterium]|nr:hypothetical protein [Propionibacteriaceae bacterium]
MSEELTVGFNPMPAAERVAYYSGLVRSRLIWLIVAVAICGVIWAWQQLDLARGLQLLMIGLAYSAIWLVAALAGLINSRRLLKSIGQGIAVRVGHWGIDLLGGVLPWADVTKVSTTRGRFGSGPRLDVHSASGEVRRLPFMYLDTMPGTIDAAVRAYSRGTRWLDTSRLGN